MNGRQPIKPSETRSIRKTSKIRAGLSFPAFLGSTLRKSCLFRIVEVYQVYSPLSRESMKKRAAVRVFRGSAARSFSLDGTKRSQFNDRKCIMLFEDSLTHVSASRSALYLGASVTLTQPKNFLPLFHRQCRWNPAVSPSLLKFKITASHARSDRIIECQTSSHIP